MPDERLYDVHVHAVIRRKFHNVAAESPKAAAQAMRDSPDVGRWLRRFADPDTIGDFSDEFSHFLVDVVGDAEFAESCWFQAEETPLLQILRTLVRWDETGRKKQGLENLLAEVRHILSRTL